MRPDADAMPRVRLKNVENKLTLQDYFSTLNGISVGVDENSVFLYKIQSRIERLKMLDLYSELNEPKM